MPTLNSRLQLALIKRKKSKNALQKGFTLVELLIVVVILGVLSSVALPSLIGTRDKADKSASLSSTLGMAQECTNALLIDSTPPTYKTNELVTVVGTCTNTPNNTVTYANKVAQQAPEGELCISTPVTAAQVTANTNNTCTVTVDANGGKTGVWS